MLINKGKIGRSIYLDLQIGKESWFDLDSEEWEDNGKISLHLQVQFPIFTPDREHIKWVKKAWGLVPPKEEPPKKQTQICDFDDDPEYDPIPF